MNRLKMITMCLLAMLAASLSAKAQEVTITLYPGWTWISYPNAEAMDIATALGDFVPVNGDIIKSQYGSSSYVNGYWRGSVTHFMPGWGYHYYSNRTEIVSFVFAGSTPQSQVTVTTSEPMLITAVSAMGGGEVTTNDGTYILVKGLCWATHENPTTNDDNFLEEGSGVGSFSATMTGLNWSTTYYVRAYAVTPSGTVYGEQQSFTTRDGIPTVTTAEVTDIQGETATCGGTVTDDGGLDVIVCGLCWSTSSNPTIDTIEIYDFENSQIPITWVNDSIFPWIVSSDTPTSNYCIKSGNSGVAGSSSAIEITREFDEIGSISFDALCMGEGTSYDKCIFSIDGVQQFSYGANVQGWKRYIFPVTAGTHTFKWSYTKDDSVNPAGDAFFIDNIAFISNGVLTVIGGTTNFSGSITCLSLSTTYYVRAYAITAAGTGYGEQVSFTTRNGIPTVSTANISNIHNTYASGGGSITDDGGLIVTARGVCWSTSPNPTLADAHSSNGGGAGTYSCYITGLAMSTTYYVRAYATNSFVTVYGNQLSFTTTNDEQHSYVDLGLPSGLLWATCNVGADNPEDYGDYFAWGETQPKDTYNGSTYQYCNGSNTTLTKYCNNSSYGYNGFTDNLTSLLPEDDAATANWGSDWRMPSKEEWQELYNNTTVSWTTQNGVNGRLFTASNGNSLFLPAAGFRDTSSLYNAGIRGYYWSSSLYTGNPYGAWYLYFSSGNYYMDYDTRIYGRSVRPVRSAQN